MNNNLKGLIAVLIVGGAVFLAYRMANKGNLKYARRIIKDENYGGDESVLISFDEDYLKEWAKASKNKQQTFSYKGTNYNTKGGKSVQ
jgi:uncharacterized protein YxeA